MNGQRRHLDESQLAIAVAQASIEAGRLDVKPARGRRKSIGSMDSQIELAGQFGVSSQRLNHAILILRHAPDLVLA